jgi:hypothetical protein
LPALALVEVFLLFARKHNIKFVFVFSNFSEKNSLHKKIRW